MEVCERYGRGSHNVEQCYAKFHVKGYEIEDVGASLGSSQSLRLSQEEHSQESKPHSQVMNEILQAKEQVKESLPRSERGVYVLELDDGYFYVGKAEKDISARIEKHRQGKGAAWCKVHGVKRLKYLKPIQPPSGTDLNAWEKNETITRMQMHGISKVRGWEFVQADGWRS